LQNAASIAALFLTTRPSSPIADTGQAENQAGGADF